MILKRNSKLINRKFIQYLIPSILMIFAMQFGSFLDGILIGNMIGSEALSATALVVPILYVIQLPGFAIGVGGSIVIANLLGKRDLDGAKRTFSLSTILAMAISILFAALAFPLAMPLASLFSLDLITYSYQYILGYMLTTPIIIFSLIMGSFMAVDNNPRLSSILFIVSNVAKIGLEILFITTFGSWSTFGAAISTGAGYLIGLIMVLFYIKSKKRNLTFSFIVKNGHFKEIFKASSSTGLNMLLTTIQMTIVNIFVAQIIVSDYEIAIYGLVANMVFLFDLVCGGIINVIPNLCGLFYGEKDLYSLKSITRKIYFINLIATTLISLFILIFPGVYSSMFGYDSGTHFDYMAFILRIYVISFVPYEISKFSTQYYPTIEKNLPSLVVVLCRELIIVLPLTLVLLFTNGLFGYCLACALTEVSTVIISYIFILLYEKFKKKNCHGVFMFENEEFNNYDVTINNEDKNASVISENITNFALQHGIANRESQIVGLASEEIVNNITSYGYKKGKQNYIDVSLKISKDKLLLRIRDDGFPFDPTKYEFDNDKNYSTSGIQLISQLVDKMTYMRVLSLNNTIFEINVGGQIDGN